YRDIRDVLAMPEVGAMGLGMLAMVGWTEGPFVDAFGQWLVTLDPPDHDRLRRLASQPFTPRQVETVATLTRTTAQRLADEMADAGTVDLYEAFGERLALSVLCEVLGVPPVDHGSM